MNHDGYKQPPYPHPHTHASPGGFTVPLPSGWGRERVHRYHCSRSGLWPPEEKPGMVSPHCWRWWPRLPGLEFIQLHFEFSGLWQSQETQIPPRILFLEGDNTFWDFQQQMNYNLGKRRWLCDLCYDFVLILYYEALLSLTSELVSVCHYGSIS